MTNKRRRPGETAFSVTDHPDDAATIVAVRGEVDLASAPELANHLAAVLSTGPATVTVDLSECEFLDSTGIGVLPDAFIAAGKIDATFSLTGATGIVLRVLDLTGVSKVLCPTESGSTPNAHHTPNQNTTSTSPSPPESDRLRPPNQPANDR